MKTLDSGTVLAQVRGLRSGHTALEHVAILERTVSNHMGGVENDGLALEFLP
jgi:hypothetical protein